VGGEGARVRGEDDLQQLVQHQRDADGGQQGRDARGAGEGRRPMRSIAIPRPAQTRITISMVTISGVCSSVAQVQPT